jgi:hypothetical protein
MKISMCEYDQYKTLKHHHTYNYMKTLLTLLTLPFLFVSCNKTKDDVNNIQREYDTIKAQSDMYQDQSDMYREQANNLNKSIEELRKTQHHLSQLSKGKKPLYVLLLNVHQSNFTLDISQHIKNSMNSSEFQIPVSEDYYNNVKEGEDLSDEFKLGSFIMSGKWGNIKVTVVKKEIKYQ